VSLDGIVAERSKAQSDLDSRKSQAARFYESKDQIKGLIDRLNGSNQDIRVARAAIAARLAMLLADFKVFAAGVGPFFAATLEQALVKDALDPQMQHALLDESKNAAKWFAVTTRGGLVRLVSPDPNDPILLVDIIENADGRWHIKLADGEVMDLDERTEGVDWDFGLLHDVVRKGLRLKPPKTQA
jgi:hypothetical protein